MMEEKESVETTLALLAKDVSYIRKEVSDIKTKMEAEYISRQEFDPIKKVVYGLVALILTGVVGAFLGLVLLK